MIKDTSGQDDFVQRQKRPWWKYTLYAVALISALAWASQSIHSLQQSGYTISRERLQLAQVSIADLERDLVVQGRVVAANSPTLYAPAQGIVTYKVKAGDKVEREQLLAQIESHEMSSELQQAQSALSRLNVELSRQEIQSRREKMQNQQNIELEQVNLTAAQREMRRAQKSIGQKVISQLDFEKFQDDLARAELTLSQARQNAQLQADALAFELRTRHLEVELQQLRVNELQRRVDSLSIHSPVTGLVGSLANSQKAAVDAHQALLTVVDLTSFEVEAQVPESYADDMGLAMPVNLRFGNQRVDGEITAVTLPRGGFIDSEGGRSIWKLDREGDRARRTAIELGAVGMRQVEVLSGLEVGDTVIVSNTEKFHRAQSLLITD
ncbi:MAG: HlyD family efflux transporter periplasmic adaptor subunit [Exilibacterium sp.]